ncbi:MAG: beta-galactosidase [Puniceicoccaceae bacterium]
MRKYAELLSFCLAFTAFQCVTIAGSEAPQRMSLTGLCGGVAVDSNGHLRINELKRLLDTNPHVSGVLLMANWKTLEPEEGKFYWDNLDEAIQLARENKRYYKLKIQPGTSTPHWVYNKGAAVFETKGSNPYRKDTYKQTLRLPIPWDDMYLREFKRLIDTVGNRYADDPYCAGVVITGANYQSGESHLPKQPEDRGKWDALNYRKHLPDAYKRIIQIFAEAFPHQQICLHVSVPIRRDDGLLDRIIEDAAKQYPERFTLQNCQLNGKRDNISLYSYGLIQKYVGKLHVGYQSVAYIGSERQGDTGVSIYNYVRGQGEYWEIWRGNALDPELCEYLLEEIARARKIGAAAYRKELEAMGKSF